MQKNKKALDVLIISILLIILGTGETFTSVLNSIKNYTGLDFLISISLGPIYIICGIILLSQKKWALKTSITLFLINVLIRIYMLFTNLYPTDTSFFIIGYSIGMSLVCFFIIGKTPLYILGFISSSKQCLPKCSNVPVYFFFKKIKK